jgi:hypothetical protein
VQRRAIAVWLRSGRSCRRGRSFFCTHRTSRRFDGTASWASTACSCSKARPPCARRSTCWQKQPSGRPSVDGRGAAC